MPAAAPIVAVLGLAAGAAFAGPVETVRTGPRYCPGDLPAGAPGSTPSRRSASRGACCRTASAVRRAGSEAATWNSSSCTKAGGGSTSINTGGRPPRERLGRAHAHLRLPRRRGQLPGQRAGNRARERRDDRAGDRIAFLRVPVAALALAACAIPPAAAGGIDELAAFVEGAKNGRAIFRQTVLARGARAEQTSSGTFAYARPGKFRWSYEKPYEQLVVGDGAKVWGLRPRPEPGDRAPARRGAGRTAALLAGDNALERNFTLVDAGEAEGLAWVEATPRAADSTFSRVRLGFKDRLPRAMELTDAFGQTTRLVFERFERNVSLPAGLVPVRAAARRRRGHGTGFALTRVPAALSRPVFRARRAVCAPGRDNR